MIKRSEEVLISTKDIGNWFKSIALVEEEYGKSLVKKSQLSRKRKSTALTNSVEKASEFLF